MFFFKLFDDSNKGDNYIDMTKRIQNDITVKRFTFAILRPK